MARLPRFNLPGFPQHLVIRSLHGQVIFTGSADYSYYLYRLNQSLQRCQCDLHAYVLLPDQVQMLVTPARADGISKMVQMLGRYYVQYFNNTYLRSGTIWDGRYRAAPVESGRYLVACQRYIDTSPVRAGQVSRLADYNWSSYRHNALQHKDPLLKEHNEYHALGHSALERADAYRELCRSPMTVELVREINCSIYKCWVLGCEQFKRDIEKRVQRRASPLPRGGDRKSRLYRHLSST